MSEKAIQTITGTVVKAGSANTITIATKVTKVHPLYRKRYTLVKKYTAHDASGAVKVGETVTIVPCRPMSKTKRWQVAA